MGEQRENLTYERFGAAVRELAEKIAGDGYEPDIVLSIARGGVFVAGGLAYALDCKNIHLVNVEFYTGVGTTFVVSSKSQCATPHRRSRSIPRTGVQCRTVTSLGRGDGRRRPCGRI
nr:phosphoribosyltransferase family protein [Streptomyces rhizosphaericus]